MNNFQLIQQGLDVTPLLLAIKLQPELWGQHTLRLDRPQSAHKSVPDIWVRYNEPSRMNDADFTELHFPVWYPAFHKLPYIRPIVFDLMSRLQATHLGGILITKIPARKSVLPHTDKGWHPEFYNAKIYVPLQSNPQCVNRVEDERVVMAAGDAWYFNNTREHEVINDGDEERITLIICMRIES